MANEYKDYMVRATAADGMIRAFAATTRNIVEEGKDIHGTYPVATAALGRLLTAGVMMGSDTVSYTHLAEVTRTAPIIDEEDAIFKRICEAAETGADLIVLIGGSGGGHRFSKTLSSCLL